MHKFTHIDAFYQVSRHVKKINAASECPEKFKPNTLVYYKGTVKLHGSNAGVCCTKDELIPQSRTRVISVDNDNYGFAKFVTQEEVSPVIREASQAIQRQNKLQDHTPIVLFGEWIGPGIQKGVAINQLPKKQWVIFAAKAGDTYLDISSLHLFRTSRVQCITSIPSYSLMVDFSSQKSKDNAINVATTHTDAVEKCCPWAKKFGIKGIGEGIVWTPIGEHQGNTDLFFKTKGKKHKITKTKVNKPQMTPERLESAREFVTFSATSNRFKQALEAIKEMGHELEMKSMTHFLKWVGQDIKRECAAELEENGLDWKSVSKLVTLEAREFFVIEVKNG